MRKLMVFGFGLVMCAAAYVATAQVRQGVLPVDQAYKVSASIVSPGLLVVHWEIAPHYYLYRGRMKFAAGKGVTLGQPKLPAGTKEHDQFLGDVVIYHNDVTAVIPYKAAPDVTSVRLTVGYQGCHEVKPKLCYPPTTKTLNLALPTQAPAATPKPEATTHASSTGSSANGPSRYTGTPAAKAAMKAGGQSLRSGKVDEAISKFKTAITLDPEYADAQARYAFTLGSENVIRLRNSSEAKSPGFKDARAKAAKKDYATTTAIIQDYEALAKSHPNNPVYPWIVSQFANAWHLARSQESYCQQSVRADKDFGLGWECLARIAMLSGDRAKTLDYLQRAMRILPDDEGVADEFAMHLEADGQAGREQLMALAKQFPKSRRIASALVGSTKALKPQAAKVAALEALYKNGSLAKNLVGSLAARSLYPIYLGSNLSKAHDLAKDMVARAGNGRRWARRAAFSAGLLKAQRDLEARHAQSALAGLKAVKDKSSGALAEEDQWYLMDASALAATGRTADGVTLLRGRFVQQPSDAIQRAMLAYGAKIGESAATVNAATWAALRANAKPAHAFTLNRLDNQAPVSLSNYRGKVVIVDFWFPTCDNCRIAFPYLDKVARKFEGKGLTVLAINIVKSQQPLALPYLKGMGYHFIGLAGTGKFAGDDYGVQGAPSTFFIGPRGKILFELPVDDEATERSAEAAVRFMLTDVKRALGHAVSRRSALSANG